MEHSEILNAGFRNLKAAMKQAGIRGDLDRKCKVAGNPIGGSTMQENALRIAAAAGLVEAVKAALSGAPVQTVRQPRQPKVAKPRKAVEVEQAADPVCLVTATVTPISTGFTPRVVKTIPASKAFGVRSKVLSQLSVDVWNDPYAPALDPGFVFDVPKLVSALSAIRRGRNCWLAGPAGTGKTEFVKNICAALGRNFERVNFDAGAEKGEFIGAEKAKDASTFWQDGAVLRGMRRPGSIILLDEVCVGRPEFLAPLHAALEPEGEIKINETGERVRKADGVCFFAADNSNGRGDVSGLFAGVREQNTAFLSRFSRVLQFDFMPRAKEVVIVSNRSGCTQQLADLIVGFVSVCRQQVESATLDLAPGMRDMIFFAEAITDGTPGRQAFEETILNRASVEGREILQQLYAQNLSDETIAAASGDTSTVVVTEDDGALE